MTQVLVAGVGNIFRRDDGFGPAVVGAMAARALPDRARVVDYGIRGMHLAYDLLEDVDVLVLVDAVPGALELAGSDEPPLPGTVLIARISRDDLGSGEFDAHGMSPVAVLSSLDLLGGTQPVTYLVGCVPAELGDGIGLSDLVAAAIEPAARAAVSLIERIVAGDQDIVGTTLHTNVPTDDPIRPVRVGGG